MNDRKEDGNLSGGCWRTCHTSFRPTLALFPLQREGKKTDRDRKEEVEQEMQKVAPSWQPSAVQQTCFRGCIGGFLGSIHPGKPHSLSVANPRWRP